MARPVHLHGGEAAALVCETVARQCQGTAYKGHAQADTKIDLPSLPSCRVHWFLLTAAREKGPRKQDPFLQVSSRHPHLAAVAISLCICARASFSLAISSYFLAMA